MNFQSYSFLLLNNAGCNHTVPVSIYSPSQSVTSTGTDSKPTPSDPNSQEKPKKKKICCACPETKKARDACLAKHNQADCQHLIDAHLDCLRKEGFNV